MAAHLLIVSFDKPNTSDLLIKFSYTPSFIYMFIYFTHKGLTFTQPLQPSNTSVGRVFAFCSRRVQRIPGITSSGVLAAHRPL